MQLLRGTQHMKYRTRPAENIWSLEELFTDYFGLSIPIVPQTSSFSNKHTFNRLFFSQNTNQYTDVDTILSFSVFKDSDLDKLKAEASSISKPIFYIIRPDENFPTGSKLSVLFSNLANKNFTGKEQPPAIRQLLRSIDYDKMCSRIDLLINKKAEASESSITEIQSYCSDVLATDTSLTHYCALFKCSTPAEYLSTFLLYSLFDDTNFVSYATEVAAVKSEQPQPSKSQTDLNNPHFQKLMCDARRINKLQEFTTYLLITLYAIQMLAAIFTMSWGDRNIEQNLKGAVFSIVMLCTSIILTALRFIPFSLHKKYADLSLILEHSVLDEDKNTYFISYSHFQNCSKSFNKIQHGRRVLITIFCIISACYIAASFLLSSFPVLVALVSTTFGMFLLIDNVSHDKTAYRNFNASFSSDHKPDSKNGLARICSWDYDKKVHSFRHNSSNSLKNYSEECIRHIYDQIVDRSKYTWATLTAFIITLSSVGVIAEILQILLPDFRYFRVPSPAMLYSVTMVILLVNGILNILILLRAKNHFQHMAEFSFYAGNPSSDDYGAAHLFRYNLYSGNISDLEIARGIYNYNFCKFEQGVSPADIQPPDDRYHPMYICRQKMRLITDIVLCFLVSYFSIAVWHTNNLKALILIPVFAAIYALWTFVLYPVIKYTSIRRTIEKIEE